MPCCDLFIGEMLAEILIMKQCDFSNLHIISQIVLFSVLFSVSSDVKGFFDRQATTFLRILVFLFFYFLQNPSDYIHRSGRTGRAGKKGTSLVFFTPNELKEQRRVEKFAVSTADLR